MFRIITSPQPCTPQRCSPPVQPKQPIFVVSLNQIKKEKDLEGASRGLIIPIGMKGENYPHSSSGRVTNAQFLIRQQGCIQLPPGLSSTAWHTALVGKEQEEALAV